LSGKIHKFLILQKVKSAVATGLYVVKGTVQYNQLTVFFMLPPSCMTWILYSVYYKNYSLQRSYTA